MIEIVGASVGKSKLCAVVWTCFQLHTTAYNASRALLFDVEGT